MWNFVNIPSGIFIVDNACETMQKAEKTEAVLRKFAIRANATACLPTGEGSIFYFFLEKNEKSLELPKMARKSI